MSLLINTPRFRYLNKHSISLIFSVIVAALLSACGGGGAPAGSAGSGELYITNGSVNATALSADGNTLYIGGTFTRVGPNTGGFVLIDDTSGLPAGSFPKVTG